jgi:hypothetical protein
MFALMASSLVEPVCEGGAEAAIALRCAEKARSGKQRAKGRVGGGRWMRLDGDRDAVVAEKFLCAAPILAACPETSRRPEKATLAFTHIAPRPLTERRASACSISKSLTLRILGFHRCA